jgi:hypothetical protein
MMMATCGICLVRGHLCFITHPVFAYIQINNRCIMLLVIIYHHYQKMTKYRTLFSEICPFHVYPYFIISGINIGLGNIEGPTRGMTFLGCTARGQVPPLYKAKCVSTKNRFSTFAFIFFFLKCLLFVAYRRNIAG